MPNGIDNPRIRPKLFDIYCGFRIIKPLPAILAFILLPIIVYPAIIGF